MTFRFYSERVQKYIYDGVITEFSNTANALQNGIIWVRFFDGVEFIEELVSDIHLCASLHNGKNYIYENDILIDGNGEEYVVVYDPKHVERFITASGFFLRNPNKPDIPISEVSKFTHTHRIFSNEE